MKFKVKGITCKNCINHVKEALIELDSKARVEVDPESGIVEYNPSISVEMTSIKGILEEYGFTVED